ncbi:MAG: hypothetical protein IPL52_14270 [Flavobacteriales bacterium]|nr:hypothetical protein [Flavobacteriales bacterium]
MKHIRSTLAVALTLHAASVAAQAIMQNVYTIPPWNNSGWFRGVVNTNDGFTLTARPVESDSADIFDIVLLRTDADGSLMWAREYNMAGSQAALGIARTANGANWVIADDDLGTAYRGMLLRTHPEDDLPLWAWAVQPTADSALRFLNMAPLDNDMVVLGIVSDIATSVGQLVVFRVAPNGSVVWSRRLNNSSLSMMSIATASDGRILLAGRGVGSGGEVGLALVALSPTGEVEWNRLYGNDIFNMANSITVDPSGGLLITGSTSQNGEGRGIVIRADAQGVATGMWLFEHEVANGYALADGSMVLFMELPGGVAQMQRVLPTGEVPWVAGLGMSVGLSQLLPYAEGARYAYITGDFAMTNTITVTTFTAQCISCTGGPGVAALPTATWLAPGDLIVPTSSYLFGMQPMTMSYSVFGAVGATSCMLPIGLDEHDAPELNCRYDPISRYAIIDMPGAGRVALSVHDAMGRLLPLTAARTEGQVLLDASDASRFTPGVYTISMHAREGAKACRFVVGD